MNWSFIPWMILINYLVNCKLSIRNIMNGSKPGLLPFIHTPYGKPAIILLLILRRAFCL